MKLNDRHLEYLDNEERDLVPTGLLVTTTSRDDYKVTKPYSGVCVGWPWPLERLPKSLLTPQDTSVIEGVDWHYAHHNRVAAVSNFPLVRSYVERCNAQGLNTRSLLCSSVSRQPSLDMTTVARLDEYSHFLGYDYAAYSCDYSTVEDELLAQEIEELSGFKAMLNDYGLFSSLDRIDLYVKARWEYVSSHPGHIEEFPYLIVLRLEEIDTSFWEMEKRR